MFKFIVNAKDRLVGVITDISNYIYIWKIIKKNRNTTEWNKFKLRHDYIGRIYTVVNLRVEDFGEADITIRESRYREKAEPIYEYLTALNLHEVVTPVVEYVPDTYSYLVKFVPVFRWLTMGWLFFFIIKVSFLILICMLLDSIFNISYLFSLIINFLKTNKILR